MCERRWRQGAGRGEGGHLDGGAPLDRGFDDYLVVLRVVHLEAREAQRKLPKVKLLDTDGVEHGLLRHHVLENGLDDVNDLQEGPRGSGLQVRAGGGAWARYVCGHVLCGLFACFRPRLRCCAVQSLC